MDGVQFWENNGGNSGCSGKVYMERRKEGAFVNERPGARVRMIEP
jgi:hypothetical protein